jgi:hypothetical protein
VVARVYGNVPIAAKLDFRKDCRGWNEAEEIARKKLVGADKITAVELSRAQLAALNIKQGDIVFEPGRPA